MTEFLIPVLFLIAFPDSGQVAPPKASCGDLWMYACPNCVPCHRGKHAVEKSGRYDLHVITVTKKNAPPPWIAKATAADPALGYPFWVFRGKGGKVFFVSGFTDLETLEKQIKGSQ